MRIDLHTHSTASDGTLTPAELVKAASGAGLDVLALTDHDTTAGWAPARAALPAGLTLLPGMELSCYWSHPHGRITLHLLVYLFDPAEEAFATERARLRASRIARAQRIVELFRADGIDVSWDEVLADAAGGTIGRPHLARALMRRGLVADTSDAFRTEWLGQRYRLPKDDTDVFEALRLARGAGGVVVFAHPRATRRGQLVPDRLIVALAEQGLFGLEADHPDHAPGERAHVRALAHRLGLVVTGSSDFHGSHKTVQLGQELTAPLVYEQIVAAATGNQPVRG